MLETDSLLILKILRNSLELIDYVRKPEDQTKLEAIQNEHLMLLDKIKKGDKWRFWIRDNPLIEVEDSGKLSLDDLVIPFDKDDVLFRPWDRENIQPEDKEYYDWIEDQTTSYNAHMKSWNVIGSLICMLQDSIFKKRSDGSFFTDCKILKHFKSYLLLFDKEPYLEGMRGRVTNMCRDGGVIMRVKLFINCMFQKHINKPNIDPGVIDEAYFFFFKDPQANTKRMKDTLHLFRSLHFTLSTSGYTIKWRNEDMEEFTVEPITHSDEKYIYLADKEEINEKLAELQDLKLYKLKDLCKNMLSMPCTVDNAGVLSWLVFYEAMTGYFHGNIPLTVKGTIEKAMETEPPDVLQEFKDNIYRTYMEFLPTISNKTENQCFADIVDHLTTRSASDNEPFSFKIQMDAIVKGEVKKVDVSWSCSDKISAFLYDYEKYINTRDASEKVKLNRPGKLFSRIVPARAPRAVYGVPLEKHIIQSFIYSELFRHQTSWKYRGKPVTTLNVDMGRVINDHREWWNASSSGEYLILACDFSAYDTSQRFVNCRLPVVQALRDYEENVSKFSVLPLIGGHTIYTLLAETFEATRQQKTRMEMGPGELNYIDFVTDYMASGEYVTLLQNNVVTWAYLKIVMKRISAAFPLFDIENVRIQGDDSIMMIKVPKSWRDQNDQVKAKDVIRIKQIVSETAKDCGLTVNLNKAAIRVHGAEFLKKMIARGMFIPRYLQINPFESERYSSEVSRINLIISRGSIWREWLQRGGVYEKALRFFYYEANLMRVVFMGKGVRPAAIPWAAMYCPLALGGVGHYPLNMLDPNLDALIYKYPWSEEMAFRISKWAYAVDKGKVDVGKDVIKQVAPHFNKGLKFIQKYEDKMLVEGSIYATQQLAKKQVEIKVPYYNRHNKMIEQAIEDNPKYKFVKNKEKEIKMKKTLELYMDDVDPASFIPPMFNHFHFILGDEIPDVLPECPVGGLDPILNNFVKNVGTSTRISRNAEALFRLFLELLNSPGYPRNNRFFRAEYLAVEIRDLGLTTIEDLTNYFLAKGGTPQIASKLARTLIDKSSTFGMLETLEGLASYSTSGDTVTNKGKQIVNNIKVINVDMPHFEKSTPYMQSFLGMAEAYYRNVNLYKWDGKMEYVRRRVVSLKVNESFATVALRKLAIDQSVYAMKLLSSLELDE